MARVVRSATLGRHPSSAAASFPAPTPRKALLPARGQPRACGRPLVVGSIAGCYGNLALSLCFQAASRAVHSKPDEARPRGCTTDAARREALRDDMAFETGTPRCGSGWLSNRRCTKARSTCYTHFWIAVAAACVPFVIEHPFLQLHAIQSAAVAGEGGIIKRTYSEQPKLATAHRMFECPFNITSRAPL